MSKKTFDMKIIWAYVYGIALSLALLLGYQLETQDHVTLGRLSDILIFAGTAIVIGTLVNSFYKMMDKSASGKNDVKATDNSDSVQKALTKAQIDKDEIRYFLKVWAVLFLMQLPVLIADYPGFFCYDAADEVNQVLTRQFSDHHPLIHVLLLGGTIAFGHKITGSWNFGICMYMVLQALVMTAVFAYMITFIRRCGVRKAFRVTAILFMGLFPTIVMYTLCSTKDGLFSAFLLLFVIKLIQLSADPEAFFKNKRGTSVLMLSAVMICLFRHNGFYAFLVFIPIALIIFRKHLKKMLILLLVPAVISVILENGMTLVFDADCGENQEMLTVSITQLARTYNSSPESFSEEDKEILFSYIPEKAITAYEPRVSDYMKSFFNNEAYEADAASYWKLWLKMLKGHPVTYLNAWFLTSYGYWYPFAVFNSYKGHQLYHITYEDSSYFEYEVEPPGERIVLIKWIDSLYYKMSLTPFQQVTPVVSLFFAPAFYFWMWAFILVYALRNKKVREIAPLIPVVLVWLTVLLGPVYVVRYVIILWYIVPLMPVIYSRIQSGYRDNTYTEVVTNG